MRLLSLLRSPQRLLRPSFAAVGAVRGGSSPFPLGAERHLWLLSPTAAPQQRSVSSAEAACRHRPHLAAAGVRELHVSRRVSSPRPAALFSTSTMSLNDYRQFAVKQLFDRLEKQFGALTHQDAITSLQKFVPGLSLAEPGTPECTADGLRQAVLVHLGALEPSSISSFEASIREATPARFLQPHRLRFGVPASAIPALTEELMAETRAVLDTVSAVPKGENTWENTIKPLVDLDRRLGPLEVSATFPKDVSRDAGVRKAATEASSVLSKFEVECAMRLDVYESLSGFVAAHGDALEGEEKRLVDFLMRDCRRNGLHLPQEKREEVETLQKEISELCVRFSTNLNEDNTKVLLTEAQLAGVPKDVLATLKREISSESPSKTAEDEPVSGAGAATAAAAAASSDGLGGYWMTMAYSVFFPAVTHCTVAETRKTLSTCFQQRCMAENTRLLERIAELRQRKAQVLGYETHAHYVLETRMAKTPERVLKFLDDAARRMKPVRENDLAELRALKREHCAAQGLEDDGKFNAWDFRFYANKRKERDFAVDETEIQQYFPMDLVLDGMFDIYQGMLGVTFEKLKIGDDDAPADGLDAPASWDESAHMYRVTDAKTSKLMGHFYLDLHPREGKYGHACCATLQCGCSDGTASGRQLPVSAMLANFSEATPEQPSLLRHSEVVTLFHEFGHAVHQLCAENVRFARFAGSRTERDFVEAPSQMLENWVFEEGPLEKMSGHWKDRSKKLPKELMERLKAAKMANKGLLDCRQLVFGIADQRLFGSKTHPVDTAKLFAEVSDSVWGIPAIPETNFMAGFAHLTGGYDATYFGYMWSEVFATDMFFTRFQGVENGVFNEQAGLDYREHILKNGGSVDGEEMLRRFLGREPTIDAFLQVRGLESDE